MPEQSTMSTQAKIYASFFLDHLVESASRLASRHNFDDERLGRLSDEAKRTLRRFQSDVGRDEAWPDATERGEIFDVALGVPFLTAASSLRRAVLAAGEADQSALAKANLMVVDDAIDELKAVLTSKDETTLAKLADRQNEIFSASTEVLADPTVRRSFGEFEVPGREWPFAERADSADVEFLDLVFESDQRSTCNSTNQHYFTLIQRTALLGAATIDAVLENERGEDARQKVMLTAYRWEQALRSLVPVQAVVQAWREPQFRISLNRQELAALPNHPSGDVDTANAGLNRFTGPQGHARGQTFTVDSEVCCSTTPSVSCMSHCPSPSDDPIIANPSTYPCCTHHC